MRKRGRIPDEVFVETVRGFLEPVAEYLDDDTVADILINGPDEVYIETGGRLHLTSAQFDGIDALMAAIKNIAQYVGKTVDEKNPLLDARLPDGSRVQITLPPCARRGPYISIRRFLKQSLTIERLISSGSLTRPAVTLIEAVVKVAKNVIVSGGTGSGKTTLLNVLGSLIPVDQRIAVIEDASELQLQQPHVIPMESRPADPEGQGAVSIRDLLRASLRMRPDRIVIGEIRSSEALDLIQAMTSGHGGAMSTLHASSPRDALRRLETMAMMADEQIPLPAMRQQIASGVNVIVQASRLEDGSRRVMGIAEVLPDLNDQGYQVREIFTFQRRGHDPEGRVIGNLVATGLKPEFLPQLVAYLGAFDESVFNAPRSAPAGR